MNMSEPMCIVGTSMGATVVAIFAAKYPDYVSMICLIAPIADEKSETDLIRKLKLGESSALIPETPEQLLSVINMLTVKGLKVPRLFLNGLHHLNMRSLEEQKKILTSLFEHDYPQIDVHYQQLQNISFPTLILWGREDRVYASTGAEYFCNLIPNTECIIFDDCGHIMSIDKPEETAETILTFFDKYARSNDKQ